MTIGESDKQPVSLQTHRRCTANKMYFTHLRAIPTATAQSSCSKIYGSSTLKLDLVMQEHTTCPTYSKELKCCFKSAIACGSDVCDQKDLVKPIENAFINKQPDESQRAATCYLPYAAGSCLVPCVSVGCFEADGCQRS